MYNGKLRRARFWLPCKGVFAREITVTLASTSSVPSHGLSRTSPGPILNIALEHGVPELSLDCGKYRVNRTSTSSGETKATTLVERMYSRRGYLTESLSDSCQMPKRLTID